MSDELKKCPFCGNVAGKRLEPTSGDYYGCANHTNMMMTIEQWNTRPIEDELQRKLDEYEGENKRWHSFEVVQAIVKERDALQAKLDIAVEALEELALFPAVIFPDFTETIALMKKDAREALKKLEA